MVGREGHRGCPRGRKQNRWLDSIISVPEKQPIDAAMKSGWVYNRAATSTGMVAMWRLPRAFGTMSACLASSHNSFHPQPVMRT